MSCDQQVQPAIEFKFTSRFGNRRRPIEDDVNLCNDGDDIHQNTAELSDPIKKEFVRVTRARENTPKQCRCLRFSRRSNPWQPRFMKPNAPAWRRMGGRELQRNLAFIKAHKYLLSKPGLLDLASKANAKVLIDPFFNVFKDRSYLTDGWA